MPGVGERLHQVEVRRETGHAGDAERAAHGGPPPYQDPDHRRVGPPEAKFFVNTMKNVSVCVRNLGVVLLVQRVISNPRRLVTFQFR